MRHKEPKAYNVRISDRFENGSERGSFTVGYWVVCTKTDAKREAKLQYPGHDKYEAILAF